MIVERSLESVDIDHDSPELRATLMRHCSIVAGIISAAGADFAAARVEPHRSGDLFERLGKLRRDAEFFQKAVQQFVVSAGKDVEAVRTAWGEVT